jgi:hypothetical protein
MQNNLPHCIPQRHRFSSVVSHNGRYFPPLWDTTKEIFPVVGYNGRGFPPLWDTTEEFFLWDTTKEVFSFVGYNGEKWYNKEWYFKILSASLCLQMKI